MDIKGVKLKKTYTRQKVDPTWLPFHAFAFSFPDPPFLLVTWLATGHIILKKPRSSGDENDAFVPVLFKNSRALRMT